MAVFAAILLCVLGITNLVNLPWFVWLTIEQIETGWGFSTNMEMLALLPLGIEFLSLPVILLATIYVVLSLVPAIKQNYLNSERPDNRKMFKANLILLIVLCLQIVITNVFIWN